MLYEVGEAGLLQGFGSVSSDSMDLFSIETNVGYRKTRVKSDRLTRIISQFLIQDIDGIFLINKPSKDSVVYEVSSSEGFYILRGENKNSNRRVVAQCKIARMEGGCPCQLPFEGIQHISSFVSN